MTTETLVPRRNDTLATSFDSTEPALYRFSVDQYHRLIEQAILTEDDRAELLEGVVVAMSPTGPRHRTIVTVVGEVLSNRLSDDWHLMVQQPVTFSASEPEPDLTIVRGRSRDYLDRTIGPADVGLIVEVSDSPLQTDRAIKGGIYAAAGIAEFWIVNLAADSVEIYTEPFTGPTRSDAGYRRSRVCKAGELFALRLDGRLICEIDAADLLP